MSDDLLYNKYKAIQAALGNYGDFKSGYVNIYKLLNPGNQNWADYEYNLPDDIHTIKYGHVSRGTPVGEFINTIRNAETIDDVKKQLELWNTYKPLDSPDNGTSYIRYFYPGFGAYRNTPSIGSKPVFPTENEPDSVQTTAGGTQGTQGTQADAKTGNAVAGGGTQGSNNGSGGTLASAGVPRGGTKTIGFDDPYDPNPGNVSLAYTMRNAPEQERRDALINAWNKEHGRESVPYIPGTKIPAGSLNRSSSTYASPGISSGGTYATGEGIKDANGNILTNPGGNADYQYALRDPSYGIYVRDRLTDAQKNYLQAVSNNMGYNYNF